MVDITNARLPIFRLAAPQLDDDKIDALAKEFGLEGEGKVPIPGGGIRITKGARYLEATPENTYWFADDDRLWNPAAMPKSLPTAAAAEHMGLDFLNRLEMVPKSAGGATVVTGVAVNTRTRTATARFDNKGKLQRDDACGDLDAYVGLLIQLQVPDPESGQLILATAQGPGTKVGIVFGDGGEIIGVNASWRDIVAIERLAPVLPPLAPTASEDPVNTSAVVDGESSRLIYRATMLDAGVPCLCPYWLFRVGEFDGERAFRTRDVATPAAVFEPVVDATLTYQPRTQTSVPQTGPGSLSIGISWRTNGSPHGDEEVALVLNQATKEGWNVRFAWRNHDAWESDWNADAATWVNQADLAYYSGHANASGWQLTVKQTAKKKLLNFGATGKDDKTGSLWSGTGGKFKWAMISACGPLHDRCAESKEDDAFNWAGAFDGFRLLMGFASATASFTREGGRTLELARRGTPLARAWLRAAREAQPCFSVHKDGDVSPGRWAAVLAAEGDGVSALSDRLPDGTGAVAGPLQAKQLRAIWTPA